MEQAEWRSRLGRLVETHISERGISQIDAAAAAGVSPPTLRKVIAGKRDLKLLEAYRLGLLQPLTKGGDRAGKE